MAGRQASSRPAKPKTEEHLVKAESNLEEYPFFAIKRRNRKLEPRVFERTLKSENDASLRQQWTVMPSAGFGTPGPLDQDVYLAVLELLERKGGMPANGKLRFSLYELVEILGWSKSGKNGGKVYRDVRDSLERIGATRIKSENAFYSKERDSYYSFRGRSIREGFSYDDHIVTACLRPSGPACAPSTRLLLPHRLRLHLGAALFGLAI